MKVVIIGQSPAAVAAISKLREENGDFDITLISTDGSLPYDRSLFPRLIAHKTKEKDVFCAAEDFYKANKVELILGKQVSRINFSRRKVFLAEKVQVEYDVLMLTDAPEPRLPEKKGLKKTGVFTLARIDQVRRLIRHLPFIETVVLELCGWTGVETALALRVLGKDVVAVFGAEQLLPGLLSSDDAALLRVLLEKQGVRVLLNNHVEDVLGEGEVQALRFASGKVVAAEMFVMEDARPDLRFLEGADVIVAQGVVVTGQMLTSVPSAYALDVMAELQEPRLIGSYALATWIGKAQAEVAVSSVKGVSVPFALGAEDARKHLEEIFSADQIRTAQEAFCLVESATCDPVLNQRG